MINARRTIILAAVFMALLGSVIPVLSQGEDNIIVNGADGVRTTSTGIDQGLMDHLAGVATRVVLECANQVRHIQMVAPPAPLQTRLNQVSHRVVIEHANVVRHQAPASPPSSLQARLGEISPRVVLQYANVSRQQWLVYPTALFNDTIAPQITNIAAAPMGGGNVKITWTTNEFATSAVLYGTQSGVYPHTVSDPLYAKQHEITLTGLTMGTRYYYRVRSTDRSGNTATSTEHSFVMQIPVYLPLVLRGYR
jgi:hypothetical protein